MHYSERTAMQDTETEAGADEQQHQVHHVRDLMVGYIDRVAERFGYVRAHRETAENARVRRILASPAAEQVLLEVQLQHARRPDVLSGAHTHAEFLRRLDELLAQAVKKVEDDAERATLYRELTRDERDPDPSFRRGANAAAGKRL